MSCLFSAPRKNPSTCPWTNPAIATRRGGFSCASLGFAAQVIPMASPRAAKIKICFIAVSCFPNFVPRASYHSDFAGCSAVLPPGRADLLYNFPTTSSVLSSPAPPTLFLEAALRHVATHHLSGTQHLG